MVEKKEFIFNVIIILLTFVGLAIGFINEQYRLLAWIVSFLIITIIIAFVIFSEYMGKIEDNTKEIQIIKKDLNIEKRLSILETKIDMLQKKQK